MVTIIITTLVDPGMDGREAGELLAPIEDVLDVGAWRYELGSDRLELTPGAREVCALATGQAPPRPFPEHLVHDDDRPAVARAFEACREDGVAFEETVRFVTGDGQTRWCRVSGERVDGADGAYVRGAIADVTRARRQHQRLTVLNRVFRHNIANDVTVIRAHADLLADAIEPDRRSADFFRDAVDPATAGETDADGHVRTIVETAEAMVETAEKARTIEQLLGEPPDRRRVALGELVANAIAAVDDPHVTFDPQLPEIEVQTDPDRLQLAIEELIGNAVAHHDGERPRISIAAERTNTGRVRLCVTDDGPGIPEIERAVLTNAEETPLRHGSGIGLWMVQWFVHQLGGRVSIADADPRGTCVELLLPSEPQGVDDC